MVSQNSQTKDCIDITEYLHTQKQHDRSLSYYLFSFFFNNFHLTVSIQLRPSPGSTDILFPADFTSFRNGHSYTILYFLSWRSRSDFQLLPRQNPRDLAWVQMKMVQSQPLLPNYHFPWVNYSACFWNTNIYVPIPLLLSSTKELSQGTT